MLNLSPSPCVCVRLLFPCTSLSLMIASPSLSLIGEEVGDVQMPGIYQYQRTESLFSQRSLRQSFRFRSRCSRHCSSDTVDSTVNADSWSVKECMPTTGSCTSFIGSRTIFRLDGTVEGYHRVRHSDLRYRRSRTWAGRIDTKRIIHQLTFAPAYEKPSSVSPKRSMRTRYGNPCRKDLVERKGRRAMSRQKVDTGADRRSISWQQICRR